MLLELSITNFAIIEATTIQFAEGFNVLTGETGAGKSILIDALGAVLGSRVSTDLVRTGAKVARVEAAFDLSADTISRLLPTLTELGVEPDGSTIILAREIHASGRSVARINGRLATASALTQIGAICVDIHGQSDHLAILNPTEQRHLLDRFAKLEPELDVLRQAMSAWQRARRQRQDLTGSSRDREDRIDLLRYQTNEIDEMAIESGEEERLGAEREILRHADQLRSHALLALSNLIEGETGESNHAEAHLRDVVAYTEDMAQLDKAAANLAERANEVLVLAHDLAHDLRNYAEQIDPDEERLQQIDDRMAAFQGLKRKYGPTLDDVQHFAQEAHRELTELSSQTDDLETLAQRERELGDIAADLGARISTKRREAALVLSAEIEVSISELRMGQSKLGIEVRQRPDPEGLLVNGTHVHADEAGIDTVEFMIAPNAGEALKPLARIASGGETARLMLATKSILSEVDLTPTLVFDEIDVGIGGRSGQVVGEKLWGISTQHQVIVITHLPQIASMASHHLRIEKELESGRTVSRVRLLSETERELEIAAMIDGLPPGEAALLNAHTMLERSRAFVESAP